MGLKAGWAAVVLCMMGMGVCSCGNGAKQPGSEYVDSVDVAAGMADADSLQAAQDSVAYRQLHEETLKARMADILENYIETEGALSDLYFSEGFRAAIAKWNQDSTHEYWTLLWNTGSVYAIEQHQVTQVVAVGDSTARVGFTLTLKDMTVDEGETTSETYTARLVLEGDEWMADNFEHNGETAR